MESPKHRKQMGILIESLELAWKGRDDFFVGGNMFLYFSVRQAQFNDFRGPDFFLVLDTTHNDRKSWVVWEENGRTPDVVIELASVSTISLDLGRKKEVYARQLKVGHYFVFNPDTGELHAWRLDWGTNTYVAIPPNASGRAPCSVIGLELGTNERNYHGIVAPWLRWFAHDGTMLPIGDELAEQERERAEQERERAEALSRRLAEYEARFGKMP